jgi:hypothetical protein
MMRNNAVTARKRSFDMELNLCGLESLPRF